MPVIEIELLEIFRSEYLTLLVRRIILIFLVKRFSATILAYCYKFIIRKISRPQYRRTFVHRVFIFLVKCECFICRIFFVLISDSAPLVPQVRTFSEFSDRRKKIGRASCRERVEV